MKYVNMPKVYSTSSDIVGTDVAACELLSKIRTMREKEYIGEDEISFATAKQSAKR